MAEHPRIEELRRRVQSDPASIAFAALAEEYRRAGRFEEAVSTCAAGLKRHPSYLSAHVTLGRALIELERYEDAQEELEFVLRAAPENLAAIRGLAEIHHRRGDAVYAPVDADGYTDPFSAPEISAARESTTAPAAAASSPAAAPDPILTAQIGALEAFLDRIVRARARSNPSQ